MYKDFNSFGLPAKLIQSLTRMQFETPTPVQAQAIPLAMAGQDVLGSAQTGTGKTAAFGIPIIAHMMEQVDAGALILTPTRELAVQVMSALQQMIPVPEIKTALLIGGEAMPKQFRQLQQRPRLIVGTPGRINDHLTRKSLNLKDVRFLVLDETDRMLDMGFGPQIEQIVSFLPKERQTMMFSATLPGNIVKMSGKYLKNPARVAVGSITAPIAKIRQEIIHTTDGDKYQQLLLQLEERKGSVLVFVKTKHGTERLAEKLRKADYLADAIHGDLQQRRRARVIQNFRDKKYRILIATDVAARGLDIPHIEHVINYDLPQCPEDYIHRIGRTARAGAEGSAVNLLTSADSAKWRAIHKLIHGKDEGAKQFAFQAEQGSGKNKKHGPKRGEFKGGFNKGGPKPWAKKEFGHGPKRDFGDRQKRDEGQVQETSAEENSERRFNKGPKQWPKKDFGYDKKRKFNRGEDRGPKRDFSDRPRRDEGQVQETGAEENSERRFNKGPKQWPKKDFGRGPKPFGKKEFGRGPKRDFGDRPRRDDRLAEDVEAGAEPSSERKFGKGPKPWAKKAFGHGEKREFGRSPYAKASGDRDPKRGFGDRPKRDEGSEPAHGERQEKPARRDRGFDARRGPGGGKPNNFRKNRSNDNGGNFVRKARAG